MPPQPRHTKNAYRPTTGLPVPRLVVHGHTSWIRSVPFLSDGKHLQVISGSDDTTVRAWSVQDGRSVGATMSERGRVFAVATSNDGKWIATGGDEKKITIWSATTHEKVVELEGHLDRIWSLAFSPDSARVVSGSIDRTVIVWNVTTGERLVGPLKGHTNDVRYVAFSPNGEEIASGGGREIRIWNSHVNKQVDNKLVIPIQSYVVSLAWTIDGHKLLAGCEDGALKCFDPSTGSSLAEFAGHTSVVRSITVSPHGKFIASASNDKTVRFWDTTTSAQIGPTLQHDQWVLCVAISADGDHLASAGCDEKIRIWSLKDIIPTAYLNDTPMTGPVDVGSRTSHDTIQPHPQEPQDSQTTKHNDAGTKTTEMTLGQLAPETAWNLRDIRSRFPDDLTGSVMRTGEDPIVSGSYGDIYRGTFHVSGWPSIEVAVKTIRTYSADVDDHNLKKKLPREIRIWLGLEHINILPLFGTTMGFGRFPAMVCPWQENGTLISYLERRNDSLTTRERLLLLVDVATGLQYLHSLFVVHGDLSGANVLVHGNGRACISDFGLSTLLTELGGSTLATSYQAKVTLRWIAPELLDLQGSENEDDPPNVVPTSQTDMYSFGGIMLHILTGKMPYHYYPREGQVVHAILKGEIPKRPNAALVTDHRWLFIQQCWAPVGTGQLRPSGEEIVEFTRHELASII